MPKKHFVDYQNATDVLTPYANKINKAYAIEITWEAYQALTETEKAAHRYVITDYPSQGEGQQLGTAAFKNVPSSGNAGNDEVVKGDDTRLNDSRNAKDVYDWAKAQTKPSYNYSEINNTPTLGTASSKDVATSGDASTSQVVMGNDTRLTDDRNAKDVYSWAKASTKPSYTATEVGAIASTLKGTANGVAELDANGKVPSAQLPSYVDDIIEGYLYNDVFYSDSAHEHPITGETGKIYVDLVSDKTYRWSGSGYVEISESLALGETSSTAYYGNKGKQNADDIATIQGLIPSSATTSNKLATANDIPDISGKADKSEMSITDGTGTDADKATIQLKSGLSKAVLITHQDISGKADKVTGATAGNLAGLDASGNLTDSEIAKTDIDDMQDELSTDYAEVTGNPINFSTLSAQNAKSTILSVEPIQDLHGYDKPWVGGAGKNLLPMTVEGLKAINTGGTWNDNTYTFRGVTYKILTDADNNVIGIKVNGAPSESTTLNLEFIGINGTNYILNGCPSNGSTSTYFLDTFGTGLNRVVDVGSGVSFQSVGNSQYVRIGVNPGATVSNLTFYPMIRLSTVSDATFAPYTNLCPISGRTEIGILGCGKNLFNPNTFAQGLLNGSTGVLDGTNRWITSDYIKVQGTITIQGWKDGTEDNFCVRFCEYDQNKNFIRCTSNINVSDVISYSRTITLESNTRYIRASFGFNNKTTTISDFFASNRIMLELGSTATAYEPYTKSNDLTISLGQTVYGGTLDVENGVLVVDRGIVDLGSLSWSDVSSSNNRTDSSAILDKKYGETNLISENYEVITFTEMASGKYGIRGSVVSSSLFIVDPNLFGKTGAEVKSALAGRYVVYELATPITIQLTPHQISLLEGVNNISVDDDFTSISLTYRDGSVATLNDVKQLENKITDNTTTSVTGNPISIIGLKSNQLAIDPVITLEPIQAGSGDPSPSNVRAITGYDKIEVLSGTKNLCGDLIDNTVIVYNTGEATYNTNYMCTDFIPVKAHTHYTITNASPGQENWVYHTDKTPWARINDGAGTSIRHLYIEDDNDGYIRCSYQKSAASENKYLQIEVGQESTAYVPYNPQIKLQLGQTIYGGTLDVEKGVLTVDYKRIDFADLSWIFNTSSNIWSSFIPSDLQRPATINDRAEGVCSTATYFTNGTPNPPQYATAFLVEPLSNPNASLWYTSSDSSTVPSGEFAYKLTEEARFTIQLTPHEISLLKDYAYVSTNGTNMSFSYKNGEMASLGDVENLGKTVNLLGTETDLQIGNLSSRTPNNISSRLNNLITAVSEQNLEKYGYKIGDYFMGTSQVSNNFRYWLADMDTFYGGYDYYAVESVHHIGIVVDTMQGSQWYTSSDITDVGYNQSTLHSYLSGSALDIIKADMIALFGGSTGLEHLLGHTKLWNKLGTWYWSDENTHSQYISALTECQLAGAKIWSADNYQQGEGHKQLNLFVKYCFNQIFGRTWIWLRSIASVGGAVLASGHGYVGGNVVAYSYRVVGLILFH